MSTLTDTAIFSKKAFRWLLVLVAALIFLFILWIIGRSVYTMFVPPKPVPATVAFGKIPKLDLSEGVSRTEGVEFKIETITGELPNLPSHLKVFAINPGESSFGALDDVKRRVRSLNFEDEPQLLGGNDVKFIQSKGLGASLTINVSSGNFIYSVDFRDNQEIIASKPKSDENALTEVKEFLTALRVNLNSFSVEGIEIAYIRIDGSDLTLVDSISQANLIQVVFRRNPIDEVPVINPQKGDAPIRVLVSERNVIDAEVNKQTINLHEFSTYPLKGVQKAFDEIKSGRGALNVSLKNSIFPVRRVSLAYLENKQDQLYLQPVYTFEGDDGAIAYVSAVDDSWVTD